MKLGQGRKSRMIRHKTRVFLDGAEFNTTDAGLEAVPDIDAHPQDHDILGPIRACSACPTRATGTS